MSKSFESVRWRAYVHRLDLGLYSCRKEFLWNGVRAPISSKRKIPSTWDSDEVLTRDTASSRTGRNRVKGGMLTWGSFGELEHVKLSEQIRPWDTLACCWDVKQPTNKQTLVNWKNGVKGGMLTWGSFGELEGRGQGRDARSGSLGELEWIITGQRVPLGTERFWSLVWMSVSW